MNHFKSYYKTRLKSTQKPMNEFWTEIVFQFNKQLTHLWLQSINNKTIMSSLKPLGIFWDITECLIPLVFETNDCINKLREFISNQFNNNCIEYQFSCLLDENQTNQSIIESIRQSFQTFN